MKTFGWTEFALGFIACCIFYWIVVIVLMVWEYVKARKKIASLWIESVKCTDKGIELLSKDKKVVDVIPHESLYIYSRVEYTAISNALKMTFLLKGNKNYSKGPYFVKFPIDSELRGYLQQA